MNELDERVLLALYELSLIASRKNGKPMTEQRINQDDLEYKVRKDLHTPIDQIKQRIRSLRNEDF
jgi:transcription initiation factor IIE alpha subunit